VEIVLENMSPFSSTVNKIVDILYTLTIEGPSNSGPSA
jgi:hypothetical protein